MNPPLFQFLLRPEDPGTLVREARSAAEGVEGVVEFQGGEGDSYQWSEAGSEARLRGPHSEGSKDGGAVGGGTRGVARDVDHVGGEPETANERSRLIQNLRPPT